MKRPVPVIVVCVIGLLIGGLGLCGLPFALVPYVADMGVPNPVIDAVKASSVLYTWTMASIGCGAVLNLLMMLCCIGALFLKGWARNGLMVYSVFQLLMNLVGSTLSVVYLTPILRGLPAEQMYGGFGGMVGGMCCGLLMPLMFLVVLNMQGVKLAFAEASGQFIDEIYE